MSNASEPKAVKARNRREKRAEERRLAAIRFAWSTPEGRRYMWDLIEFAGLLRNPMTGNGWTEFNCGSQNVAQRIFADVSAACPEMFILAREEAMKFQKREDDAEGALTSSTTPEKEDADG